MAPKRSAEKKDENMSKGHRGQPKGTPYRQNWKNLSNKITTLY